MAGGRSRCPLLHEVQRERRPEAAGAQHRACHAGLPAHLMRGKKLLMIISQPCVSRLPTSQQYTPRLRQPTNHTASPPDTRKALLDGVEAAHLGIYPKHQDQVCHLPSPPPARDAPLDGQCAALCRNHLIVHPGPHPAHLMRGKLLLKVSGQSPVHHNLPTCPVHTFHHTSPAHLMRGKLRSMVSRQIQKATKDGL